MSTGARIKLSVTVILSALALLTASGLALRYDALSATAGEGSAAPATVAMEPATAPLSGEDEEADDELEAASDEEAEDDDELEEGEEDGFELFSDDEDESDDESD